MKIFRQPAGVVSAEPVWVCVRLGLETQTNTSLAGLLGAISLAR
jgi:hypothetical protein